MVAMELGGNISLSGFSDRDFTELIIVKKMVGQYARKFTDSVPGFAHLGVTLKPIHQTQEGHGKVEIVSKVHIDGKEYASEVTDHNMFVALDKSLKHCLSQVEHARR